MSLLVSLALSLCLVSTSPDVVSSGYKRVLHDFTVENSTGFEGWQFVAVTPIGPSELEKVEPGKSLGYSRKYGTRIVAGPEPEADTLEGQLSRDWFRSHAESPQAQPPVVTGALIPVMSPTKFVSTTVRILSVSPEELLLEWVEEAHFDEDHEPIPGSGVPGYYYALIGVGVGGLVAMARRNKRMSAC